MALQYFCAVLRRAVLCCHAEAMLLEQRTMRCRNHCTDMLAAKPAVVKLNMMQQGRRDPIHKLPQHVHDMYSSDLMTL